MKLSEFIHSKDDLNEADYLHISEAIFDVVMYVTRHIDLDEMATFTARLESLMSIYSEFVEDQTFRLRKVMISTALLVEHLQSNRELLVQLVNSPVVSIKETGDKWKT